MESWGKQGLSNEQIRALLPDVIDRIKQVLATQLVADGKSGDHQSDETTTTKTTGAQPNAPPGSTPTATTDTGTVETTTTVPTDTGGTTTTRTDDDDDDGHGADDNHPVTRFIPLVALLALVTAGCGGSESVLSRTGKNVAKIHSGVLDLKLIVTPHGSGHPFGFELNGPFSLREGKLPIARVVYTQIANGQSASATFVSNGAHAWVVSGKGTRELSTAAARGLTFTGGFTGMDIASWVKDAKVVDAGPGLDRVTGTLDVVAAANGLRGVAALAGRNVAAIQGSDADRLRAATKSSSIELLTSKGARLLRRLSVSADLGFNVPATLKRALGADVGAEVDFLMSVARPNSRVVVQGP